MTEYADFTTDVLDKPGISKERQERLNRARGMAEWYLLRVQEHAPDLLPAAHVLMSRLDQICAECLDATIFLTKEDPELGDDQFAVTIEHPEGQNPTTTRFVVPAFEFFDGRVPIADFFADPAQQASDSGLDRDYHAIRSLVGSGSLELAIDYGSPAFYGEHAPAGQ